MSRNVNLLVNNAKKMTYNYYIGMYFLARRPL